MKPLNAIEVEKVKSIIFLLHARYDGRKSKLCKHFGIPKVLLNEWIATYEEAVLTECVKKEEEEETGVLLTIPEMREKIMKRMSVTIGRERDPSKLSKCLKDITELEAVLNGDAKEGDNDFVSTVEDKINK